MQKSSSAYFKTSLNENFTLILGEYAFLGLPYKKGHFFWFELRTINLNASRWLYPTTTTMYMFLKNSYPYIFLNNLFLDTSIGGWRNNAPCHNKYAL